MAWRGRVKSHCIVCGEARREGETLSARGKCPRCGVGRTAENARQLHAHSGPYFDHWRRRGAAAYGAILLDDLASGD